MTESRTFEVGGVSALLRDVERGAHATLTRHGEPVALLVPFDAGRQERVRAAVQRIRELGHGLTLPEGTTIKDLVEEGRRS